ncbi:MAG: hypothetical protein EOO88_51925 [Pedobacter sp.]|nr:MAG: hypothetical protein EOO88_51925 [Pedobacter sp.]
MIERSSAQNQSKFSSATSRIKFMESTDTAELTEAQKIEWRVALDNLNKFMKRSSNYVNDFPFFHIMGSPIGTQSSPDDSSKIMRPHFTGLNLGHVYDLSKEQAEQEHITLPAPIDRPDQIEIRQEHEDGTSRITLAATKLYVSNDEWRKLLCDVAGEIWEISTLLPTIHEGPFEIKDIRDAVATRNRAWETELAKGARPKSSALATTDFPIHTSQEIDALICGAADGKRGAFWRNELTRGARVWEHKKHAHRLEVACASEFDAAEVSFETIEKLTSDQDADFALALFYVAGVLCPPPHCPRDRPGEGWIELNDVMGKIGWFKEKPNAQKREQLRHKLWRFLVFGEEVSVIGSRGGVYKDKQSGRKIETYIESLSDLCMPAHILPGHF